MLNLLEALGFAINWKKLHLMPSQEIQFLGFQVDSREIKLFLPQGKVDHIVQQCRTALSFQTLFICHLSQLLGKMSAAAPAVLVAQIHYRQLQQAKIRSLRWLRCFDVLVTLNPSAIQELEWWRDKLGTCNGKRIAQPLQDLMIETDASRLGWEAVCNGIQTGGLWSLREQQSHINVLELQAGIFHSQSRKEQREHTCASENKQYFSITLCQTNGGNLLS